MLAWNVPFRSTSAPATPGKIPMLDFSRQYQQIRAEILAAIEQVCDSQHFILGREVQQFETDCARFCDVAHAVACASGTDALWLAMEAAEVGPGHAVLTSPFTFFSTVSSILRVGARPLFADIDPKTYNLDPERTAAALENPPAAIRVRAVLPIHLYGQCADWDRFTQLQKERNLFLIEDAAQAFGAKWNGRPAGSLGDLAAFSFYPTKNLSAYGDAGLLTTGNDHFADRAQILRVHGMRERYFHEEIGWNSRLDTIQAAVLLVKLRYIESWNQARRHRAEIYDQLFAQRGLADAGPYPDHGVVLPYVDPRGTHVFHQYVIRVPRRDALRKFLTERGIGSEVYYPVPLHLQKPFANLGYTEGEFPESERAAKEVLALPMFPELTLDEQQRVVTAIAEFLS